MPSKTPKRGGFRGAIKKIVHVKATTFPMKKSSMKYVKAVVSPTILVSTSILQAGYLPSGVGDTCGSFSSQLAAGMTQDTTSKGEAFVKSGGQAKLNPSKVMQKLGPCRPISRETTAGMVQYIEYNMSKGEGNVKLPSISYLQSGVQAKRNPNMVMKKLETFKRPHITRSRLIEINKRERRYRASNEDIIKETKYTKSVDVLHDCRKDQIVIQQTRKNFSQIILNMFKIISAVFFNFVQSCSLHIIMKTADANSEDVIHNCQKNQSDIHQTMKYFSQIILMYKTISAVCLNIVQSRTSYN